jgi:RNA polymerase sigma-70 factor (ECF subfamily)
MAYKKLFGVSQRRAFKRLVANNRERLYRMAYAWTSDPHLADDLVQQTLLKALSNQKQLRDFGAAEGWLFRILANCLTDYRRAKREFLSGDDLEIVDRITPEHRFKEEQLVQKVRQAVQNLPINHCQVITLVDLEEFSYASVAQILDIPVGTVMSRLCRGRRALREQLLEIKPRESSRPAVNIKRIK